MGKILIVDDEESIIELISYNLAKEGFKVEFAVTGKEALQKITGGDIDLILLDWMIPEPDGLEVCRRLRSNPQTAALPIIMLTAKGEEVDKVLGLEMGANDYVTKPFSPRELIARVRANLRASRITIDTGISSSPEERNIVEIKGIHLDAERYVVQRHGHPLDVSPKEFELLFMLASRPGRVFRREEILNRIWGYDFPADTRTVDVHVRHLRQKIEDDPQRPRYLLTVRGVGYKFAESSYS